ncbi:unnamed protein product [Mytilus coruscus]|uniref:Uncharacterized protein n=1 Tax=Mytilus coruscus TaxID=42192 RepID=A0A6J8DV18_MYTCO|nr:unnamed protein product [Mytilus coruscus]
MTRQQKLKICDLRLRHRLKSSEDKLVIEYVPTKTRPIANVELVSTDNVKTYTVQFFNEDGTVTTRKVNVGEKATSVGTKPDVKKSEFSTSIPSTTTVPQTASSAVITTAEVTPTPTATPEISTETTQTLKVSSGKVTTPTQVSTTSPSPGLSITTIATTTPICEETDGMNSITTIPSTEITTNDKTAEIENLRPSSKTPFKSSEDKLVIEYVPTKTRPIANVELVSTDNVKTYTVQFFNEDGTMTTRKVISTSIPSTTTVPQTASSAVITTAEVTPTPTATPEISTETTQTLKVSSGKVTTPTQVSTTSPSPGLSITTIATTTPICEETDGMNSITTIPSTEITTNDKTAEIENLRPSSKTPFKSSEDKLVIEYVPTKTRPIANVELVSTDNVKTYTVQFFNEDGTVTTRKVISTSIPSTTTVPQTASSAVITTAEVTPTPTATPEISTETTQTLKVSSGKVTTPTQVSTTSPSPGLSITTIATTTPICEETDGMNSITTIPSTEITTNDKTAEIENLRPSSKTPFKSSEDKLVIEYVPTKTRPIANVELVSTDNVKTYTVQFFNEDGTVTTRKVISTSIPSTTTVPQTASSAVITTAEVTPTPTATPEISTETTQTLKVSSGKVTTPTQVSTTSPSPGLSITTIATTTPICEETDGMNSITTIPSTEITTNDKTAEIENLRPSSKTPFKKF